MITAEQQSFVQNLKDEEWKAFYALLLVRLKIPRHSFAEVQVRGVIEADPLTVDKTIEDFKSWLARSSSNK